MIEFLVFWLFFQLGLIFWLLLDNAKLIRELLEARGELRTKSEVIELYKRAEKESGSVK